MALAVVRLSWYIDSPEHRQEFLQLDTIESGVGYGRLRVQRVNMDRTQSWPNDFICHQNKFVLGFFEQRTHQMYLSTEKLTAEKEDLAPQGLSRLLIHSCSPPFPFTYKVTVFLYQKVELADH